MNIVVSASGPDMESQVDNRFGRCPYFILVEVEDKKIKGHKSVENTSANQMGGAGMTAAQAVADMKADAIITVNLGPRAFIVFKQLGMEIYQGTGTVKEAVEDFISGKLKKIDESTGPGHMGMPGFGPK
ncbi:MAG: NifB/NifX family molybdenum-iron cluster-binding protein [Candidatus Aenigmarchaeota archaeon]|nr:NifB/NifX family molybdenum-iron cluster-binding protein [Candidatus Aenigmarchaeota archaeon]